MRSETFARQKELGVIPAFAQLTPRPKELPAWDSIPENEQKLYALAGAWIYYLTNWRLPLT